MSCPGVYRIRSMESMPHPGNGSIETFIDMDGRVTQPLCHSYVRIESISDVLLQLLLDFEYGPN